MVVTRQIADLGTGPLRLRVPKTVGERRRISGSPFHVHPELFVQVRGATLFVLPGERFSLESGWMCLMPRLVPHAERVVTGADGFSNLVIMPFPDTVSFHFAGDSPTLPGRPYVREAERCPTPEAALLANALDELVRLYWLYGPTDAEGREVVRHQTIALLYRLLASFGKRDTAPAAGHPKVLQARDQIALNLSDPNLSVKTLAGWIGCSADYLSHLFRRETGETIGAWITRRRLATAESLLRQGTLTVSEVAWACGYGDPAYFSRVFRATRGCSPRQYRSRG